MKFLSNILKQLAYYINKIANYIYIENNKVKEESLFLKKNHENKLFLYDTPIGKMWLENKSIIDKNIIKYGFWEKGSTYCVNKLINKNDIVFDIGANIGYFTIIFSNLVGKNGKVYAFEPTQKYFKRIKLNIIENQLENVNLFNFGFSDQEKYADIMIDNSTATLHPQINDQILQYEKIKLTRLTSFVKENNISQIHFIKIDIDGHEPYILDDVFSMIDKFNCIVLFEINHLSYFKANVPAWDIYNKIIKKKYFIYTDAFEQIINIDDFLIKTSNFAYSSNVIISKHVIH
ncbi:MAG: FkbM family methyltransferase [Bacteroidia bacterium]|nr:FkbM family methyltransferase [Bacteroidia bacterium]